MNGGYYYSPSGEAWGRGLVWTGSREESVAGTPYTYHNGLAMFTSDTGQITHHHPSLPPSLAPSLGLTLQQVPGKGTTGTTAPLPVLYGPGTANTTAMFLQGGSGQQIQLQAVQSQVSGFIHNVQVIDWNSLYSGEFDCIFLCNTTGQRYSHPLLEKVVSLDQNTKHQFQLFPAAGFCCKVKLLRRESQ